MTDTKAQATGWLLVTAAGAVVGYLIVRALQKGVGTFTANKTAETGTSSGGLLPGVGSVLAGAEQFSQTVSEDVVAAGSGSVAPVSGGGSTDPLAYISGAIVNPPNGGTVKRGLFSDTVRWTAEFTNSAATAWTGEVRFEVSEDYLLKDSKGSYSRIVTVPGSSSLRLEVDYLLRGGVQIREPNLFINVFAGTKYLGQHRIDVT